MGYFCRMEQLLIVGGGLAGTILAAETYSRGISFRWMISNRINPASAAAYGMCNPVHIRNRVPAWKADELYETSRSFFQYWQQQSVIPFFQPMPIHHLVVDAEEFVQWRQNTESTSLWKYTLGEPQYHVTDQVKPGYSGSILINESFFVAVPRFMDRIQQLLSVHIEWSDFDYPALEPQSNNWLYKGNTYTRIIFSEGYYGSRNPYFNQVPFNPCKGEMLEVDIPGLEMPTALHKKIMLVPAGNGRFLCGATYRWDELDDLPTASGRKELEEGLQEIIGNRYTYEVINHKAGVRPAMADRRPVTGWHPAINGIGILNGFGSRGLMVGPAAAKNLLDHLEHGTPIWPDWDIARFKKRLLKNL